MNNIIKQIIEHRDIDKIFRKVLNNLYIIGPVSITDMEILLYLNIYAPEEFVNYKNEILKYMGVNYKEIPVETLTDSIFGMYKKYVSEQYNYTYTPVQVSIVKGISNNQCFSFSAPTSTGKSYVFRNIIENSELDVVVIVPSRALINEYYFRICRLITDKTVNILTFIDKINTKYAKRNVFIVTPERCKELFKHKDEFNIEYFMFDEAQLSDEDSSRGLYFDSIVRRIQKAYPNSKFIFAHPFVKNPEAQIIKNHFDENKSYSYQYIQKNVGQMFLVYEKDNYYHFGIDKKMMGSQKILCNFDPIEKAIKSGGSVLVYTSKASIYKKEVFDEFDRYIRMCTSITDIAAKKYISQIKSYIGATDKEDSDMYSQMLHLLKHGVVVHHGSLPLQARMILERFTQEGFCRICFATSTLEQGINMPFEVVFLNTFKASKPLALKNLIGRAGRSTLENKFDYGYIIMHKNNMSKFREIFLAEDTLKEVSLLDEDNVNDDYKDFKEAILTGTLSDKYNLTEKQLEKLSQRSTDEIIERLLGDMFCNDVLISLETINQDPQYKLKIYRHFEELYEMYLDRRMYDGEKSVFDTAIKIMIWKIHCKTFKDICFYRYSYASCLQKRKSLQAEIKNADGFNKIISQRELDGLYAAFVTECKDIPDKNIRNFSMFGNREVKAKDVDYDRIVFDTYDYLDKIIGFKLSDIFYAAFAQYYERTNDIRADKLAKYVKYGTDSMRHIWMLRYGLTFEDIEWVEEYIDDINEEEIKFKTEIKQIDETRYNLVARFINN
ncbi:DEAD/DEAH box helicase [Anaerocolumna xylanovorans]|uniref:Helicase conserved C-terminal domain-containing protein n=1 Tax=Anaerocolumna xylanovorans DSM 12503 TaxID=1121345 RepID=A0A1M7Y8G7_9FIRM|nr:DEAD/DEAH box helicase [Anaerocolumna xylanovorans]SHO48935.1 Helicase conserved C-terminal domain-containing protein [Anaerocolumna xylanovorans DSM 12503]